MITHIQRKQTTLLYRIFSTFIVATFIFSSTILLPRVYAQTPLLNLPVPGTMVSLSTSFTPAIIRGMTINPESPLQFKFIIDIGDDNLEGEAFKEESSKLIKYFFASLTTPENEMWVNLSPYERNRIITEDFGQTEMGRDLLAQDYILKQITASLIYPESKLGKEFWDKVYKKTNNLYDMNEIPINTFNKVWIIPEKAVVHVSGHTVFVSDSRLKVMLEEDYLAIEHNSYNKEIGIDQLERSKTQQMSDVSSNIIKEIILPEIEREVNEESFPIRDEPVETQRKN